MDRESYEKLLNTPISVDATRRYLANLPEDALEINAQMNQNKTATIIVSINLPGADYIAPAYTLIPKALSLLKDVV